MTEQDEVVVTLRLEGPSDDTRRGVLTWYEVGQYLTRIPEFVPGIRVVELHSNSALPDRLFRHPDWPIE